MKKQKEKPQFKGYFTGMTGVFVAAAELSTRGFIVAITSRNAEGVDILASKGGKTYGIQVKTNRHMGGHNFWLLSKKNLTKSPGLFYIFVNLKGEGQRSEFYIAKSVKVAKGICVEKSKSGTWYSYGKRLEDKEKWEILK